MTLEQKLSQLMVVNGEFKLEVVTPTNNYVVQIKPLSFSSSSRDCLIEYKKQLKRVGMKDADFAAEVNEDNPLFICMGNMPAIVVRM